MNKLKGFTLFELLVTLSIMAILMTLSVPGFRSLVEANKLDKVRDDLFADMVLARSEALARNKPVTVCATLNPAATDPECSNSDSWTTGWIVFIDTDQDAVVDPEVDADSNAIPETTADEYIRIYRGRDTGLSISWKAFSGTDHTILFDRLGRMSSNNNGSFHFCDNSIDYAQRIVVSKIGRARFDGGATCT